MRYGDGILWIMNKSLLCLSLLLAAVVVLALLHGPIAGLFLLGLAALFYLVGCYYL